MTSPMKYVVGTAIKKEITAPTRRMFDSEKALGPKICQVPITTSSVTQIENTVALNVNSRT